MVAVQSDTLLHALRVQLKRKVSARRGGDYNPSIFLVMLYKKRARVLKFSYPPMRFTYGTENIVSSLRGWREKVVIFLIFFWKKAPYHP